MNNKTELLPCPFCGSTALHYDNGYATCPKYRCPVNGLVVKNEEWNTRAAPAEDVRAAGEEPVAYTCIGKGGRYEILGLATGAGLTRGEDRLVYRDISTGRLFLRTEADFSQRMERLNK